jgi:hypothetical protein
MTNQPNQDLPVEQPEPNQDLPEEPGKSGTAPGHDPDGPGKSEDAPGHNKPEDR